jgi:hypothetical protein
MGCQVEIANKIIAHEADYLLALKGNQPTLEADVESYFSSAPADKLVTKTTVEKGHGRIETRVYAASQEVDWIVSERSYPGQPRFTNHATSSVPHRSTSTVLPTAYGATGASKACTGSWMSSSRTICRATERPRCQKHGRRQTLRPRPRTRQKGQGKRQNPSKVRRLGSEIPARNPPAQMTVNLDSVPCQRRRRAGRRRSGGDSTAVRWRWRRAAGRGIPTARFRFD